MKHAKTALDAAILTLTQAFQNLMNSFLVYGLSYPNTVLLYKALEIQPYVFEFGTKTGKQRQTNKQTTVKTEPQLNNLYRLRIEARPTALPRPHALDPATAAGLGRVTPHASPC